MLRPGQEYTISGTDEKRILVDTIAFERVRLHQSNNTLM